jgi:hypothetical protein
MIIKTILFVLSITILFSFIENKSNFPKIIMIPFIVSSITKFCLGDWDKEYIWSISDLFYWITLFSVSIITILFIDFIKNKES